MVWVGRDPKGHPMQPLPSESIAPNPSPDSLGHLQGCSAQLDPPGLPSPAWAAPVQLCSFGMGVWGSAGAGLAAGLLPAVLLAVAALGSPGLCSGFNSASPRSGDGTAPGAEPRLRGGIELSEAEQGV